jgi:hypothetical protein
MDKIEITRDDFRRAIAEVSAELAEDTSIEGMAKLLIPMTGMVFASKMEDKLFDEKSDTIEN